MKHANLITTFALSSLLLGGGAMAQTAGTVTASTGARDLGVAADVNADRVFIAPTALTQPAGSVAFNSYELFFAGITAAPTDRLQLSAWGLLPVFEDFPIIINGSGKFALVNEGALRLALQGGVSFASVDGTSGGVGTLGAAATICTDDACHSMVNFYAAAMADINGDGNAIAILGSAGVVQRVTDHVKLALELDTAGAITENESELVDGFLLFYGVRFTGTRLGVDLGFAKPLVDEDTGLFMGIPWVAFTYRAQT